MTATLDRSTVEPKEKPLTDWTANSKENAVFQRSDSFDVSLARDLHQLHEKLHEIQSRPEPAELNTPNDLHDLHDDLHQLHRTPDSISPGSRTPDHPGPIQGRGKITELMRAIFSKNDK